MQAAGGADGDDARDAEGAGGARGGGRRRAEGSAVGGSEGAKAVVLSIVFILKRSFYHDRLGTNIGKSSQKIVFAEGSERSPRLPARNLERCAHHTRTLTFQTQSRFKAHRCQLPLLSTDIAAFMGLVGSDGIICWRRLQGRRRRPFLRRCTARRTTARSRRPTCRHCGSCTRTNCPQTR